MSQQPNIIYILTDDQRADMLGSTGHPILKTPHLDQLTADGIRFNQAFCTSPVCTPSRACHYLGQWERRHGVNFNSHSSVSPIAWEDSFPMVLKKAGYFLGWVGKNHVPVGAKGYKSGYIESVFDYWYGNHGHSGFYPKERKAGFLFQNAALDTQIEVFEEGVHHFLEPDSLFLDSCPVALPQRPQNKPFCLCLTFNLPHSNGTGSMELRETDDPLYVSAYQDIINQIPLPQTYIAYDEIKRPRIPKEVYNGDYIDSYNFVKTPEALRERLVRMYQTVTGIDMMIGRLREKLEQLKLADNTIIVYSTDHGLHLGEHGLGGKNLLYEEDLRIPLIIHDPRLPKEKRGKVLEQMVTVPDLAPTVLDLAGLKIPDAMQGNSLKPLMTEEDIAWREDFFAEALMDIQNYAKSECVRNREWKYIRYFPRTEDPAQQDERMRSTLDNYADFLTTSVRGDIAPVYEELYHLTEDPFEEHNLAELPEYQEKLKALKQRLIELASEKL